MDPEVSHDHELHQDVPEAPQPRQGDRQHQEEGARALDLDATYVAPVVPTRGLVGSWLGLYGLCLVGFVAPSAETRRRRRRPANLARRKQAACFLKLARGRRGKKVKGGERFSG